jgi:hypothetical protein
MQYFSLVKCRFYVSIAQSNGFKFQILILKHAINVTFILAIIFWNGLMWGVLSGGFRNHVEELSIMCFSLGFVGPIGLLMFYCFTSKFVSYLSQVKPSQVKLKIA